MALVMAIMAIMVVGALVIGVGTTVVLEHRQAQNTPKVGQAFSVSELGLNDAQKQQMTAILSDARRESRHLHEQLEPAVHEHIRRTRERVVEILTTEQVETLDALTEEHRGDLERMFLTPGVP